MPQPRSIRRGENPAAPWWRQPDSAVSTGRGTISRTVFPAPTLEMRGITSLRVSCHHHPPQAAAASCAGGCIGGSAAVAPT